MPKFSISAHELTDTNVDFVALVKRGANRIPFRLTKGDNEMLDLYSIGRRMFKSDEPAPVVIGAILTKGADVEGAVAVLKSVGVDFRPSSRARRTASSPSPARTRTPPRA